MDLSKTSQQPRIRRHTLLVAVVILFVLILVALLSFRLSLPRHPMFGAIYEAVACDLHVARANSLGAFLRKQLPRRVVQSPYFPSRFKDQPRYLDLKGEQLEWSICGPDSGWLYFWDIGFRPRASKWEFAPCSETDLAFVTSLPMDFIGSSDPDRVAAFGSLSTTNAINVLIGQILFARQTGNKSTIYILKFKEQPGERVIVEYCVAHP